MTGVQTCALPIWKFAKTFPVNLHEGHKQVFPCQQQAVTLILKAVHALERPLCPCEPFFFGVRVFADNTQLAVQQANSLGNGNGFARYGVVAAYQIGMYYGTANNKVKFGNPEIEYPKGYLFTSSDAVINAMVNPADIDIAQYTVTLEDSHGNTCFVLASPAKNMSSDPLKNQTATRAEQWNKGIYDFTIGFANVDAKTIENGKDVAYALSTSKQMIFLFLLLGLTQSISYCYDKTVITDARTLERPSSQETTLFAFQMSVPETAYDKKPSLLMPYRSARLLHL